MTDGDESQVEVLQKQRLTDMHGQTARLEWRELARFFAAGKLVLVAQGLDLVQVAAAVADDDARRVAELMASGDLLRVGDEQAKVWEQQQPSLWAVVVAPWVLVQEVPGP